MTGIKTSPCTVPLCIRLPNLVFAVRGADALERDIVKNPKAKLRVLIRDMLDALAKGFSVNEIIWDTGAAQWKPAAYKYRDPRWFQYDRETGTRLCLRAPYGNELEPLKP